MALDARKFQILRAIVDDYILTAAPVGSRTLSRRTDIGLSSATIRNEMSDLEELGYLDQPHTSAGRVPSLRAFRLYVDQLMQVSTLGKTERDYIRMRVGHKTQALEEVLQSAAEVLGEITDYTSAVLTPRAELKHYRHIQLVPITETTALVVIVTDAAIYKDLIISTPPGTTPDMLQMLSNMLTANLKGRTSAELGSVVSAISDGLRSHAKLAYDIVQSMAESTARQDAHQQLMLGGRTNLLKHPEYSDVEKVRSAMAALEPHSALAQILSQKAGAEFSISIGPELGSSELSDMSLVTVSYHLGGVNTGTMGIIGPVRMDYARVAAVLMQMQDTLNGMLNS